jgi:hypothetical protein
MAHFLRANHKTMKRITTDKIIATKIKKKEGKI